METDDKEALINVVQKAQEYFKSVVPEGVSLIDELLAERKEEAKRE